MNIGPAAAVPAATIIRQLTPDLWIGLGINSPFGLTTGTPDSWPGRFYGEQATFESFNFNPTIAYKINNWISVGAGVQAQYATTNQTFGLPVPTPTTGQLNLSGSGWGFGFTAGVTVNPWAGTTLGLGYRSFINQTIDGTLTVPLGLPATTGGAINSTVRLPDQLSGGIKQRINDQWTLLGTVEWDNWSRIGTTTVNTAAGGPALVVGTPLQLPFQYRDGWLFSGGVEYNAAPGWVLRGGAGYEISPITTGVRIPALPDSNRIWLTAGLTKAIFPGLYLDLSYAHLFMQNADMNITSLANNPWFDGVAYTGTAVNHIDILSLGLRLQLSPPPPTPLVTKG
jgi:long-chain fatty acid transport protein